MISQKELLRCKVEMDGVGLMEDSKFKIAQVSRWLQVIGGEWEAAGDG